MWCENEIDYILKHLQNPENLLDPEFVEWLKTEDHLNLFEKIRNHREALLRFDKEQALDVDIEYQRFKTKNISKRSSFRLNTWLAVAGCVIALVVFGIAIKNYETQPVPDIVSTALTGRKCAELILANGEHILLNSNSIQLRESNGIFIENDTNLQLVYRHQTDPNGSVDTALVYNILKIPSGADYVVNLSDGTKVHLNCETELRYPTRFAGNERRVYLNGEAFFEVEKSEAWPFIVVTDQMCIQVTGTKFNVRSYQSEDIAQTTLVEGAVTVTEPEDRIHTFRLLPSQQFSLDKLTGRIEVKEVDTHLYTDWIEGMFVFRKQRLEEVMNMLARWYDIEVFYGSADLKDLRLSANLGRYDHIDTILDMIRAMDKVVVDRKGKVITFCWK